MNIDMLVRNKRIRPKHADKKQIKALIDSAVLNAGFVKKQPVNKESSTVIFRELYESVRQLGEARWLIEGYEPLDHDIALEILKEIKIKTSRKLNFLGRFKKIRHDANYRGYIIPMMQTKEMIEFWNNTVQEIITILIKKTNQSG